MDESANFISGNDDLSIEQQTFFDAPTFLATVPLVAGVYRMYAADGQLLYVGKSKILRQRLRSYFRPTGLSARIARMVAQIHRIEITVTHSEAEALLLENNLIKAQRPKYNIIFRDDKSYPYLIFTAEPFPQMRVVRGLPRVQAQYFGPFPQTQAVHECYEWLQKIFQLRTCEPSVFANRSRPCLLHQINRCHAPCVGALSAADYQLQVQHALWFLQGKSDAVIAHLQEKMQQAAKQLAFEVAARWRDQIQALRQLQTQQAVTGAPVADADLVLAFVADAQACVTWVMVRGGRHVGERHFFPPWDALGGAEELVAAFLHQHYQDKRLIPPEIVVNVLADAQNWATLLSQQAQHPVRVRVNPRGAWQPWLKLADTNAQLALQRQQQTVVTQQQRLHALRERLAMPTLDRIECFDISHTQGEATTASCVVYDEGQMQPKQYRHYHITVTDQGDDYAAMYEVLSRRYRQTSSVRPDLVLIDGGQGQVKQALKVLALCGLSLPVLGIAKGESRRAGEETLIFGDERPPVHWPAHEPALHLLQHIRDEAHRFAITGHRARRAKARQPSLLNQIPQVGAKRRQALLQHFGGIAGVLAADENALARVEGISPALAASIWAALHNG